MAARIRAGLAGLGPLLTAAAAVIASLWVLSLLTGDRRPVAGLLTPGLYILSTLFSAFGLYAAVPLERLRLRDAAGTFDRATGAWLRAATAVRRRFLTVERLTSGIVASIAITLLFNAYNGWKLVAPTVRPFTWDPALAELDRALHGGRFPHEHLASVLTHPAATRLLDFLYIQWGLVLGGWLVCWAWRADSADRRRILGGLVFVLVVLGMWGAALFSSAGPTFFGPVTGLADPYAPHLAWLVRDEPGLDSARAQQLMWQLFSNGKSPLYFGISAMPSIHVALVMLFTLGAWRLHPALGAAMSAFTVLTLVATVHLGWHYAVDGYVSVLLVSLYWWATRSRGASTMSERPAAIAWTGS